MLLSLARRTRTIKIDRVTNYSCGIRRMRTKSHPMKMSDIITDILALLFVVLLFPRRKQLLEMH